MGTTTSRLIKAATVLLFLIVSLNLHPQAAEAVTGYALGPLSGQNGWNGGINSLGTVLSFNTSSVGAADVVNTQSHTGSQSWYFAKGSNTPGAGTPFSPIVTTAGAPDQGASGDMVVISFAFKAAHPGDGSRIQINEGTALRDDRTGTNIYMEAVAGSDYVRLYMVPASQTDVIGANVELGHFSAADWHVVEMTTIYPDTSVNPDDVNSWGTTTYKVDGIVVGTANPWAHWWRYQGGLESGDPSDYPYAPGSSIKFSNYYNDASHYGFYFDDVSFRVIDSDTHATVAAFSTSFESSENHPSVASAPVSGSYTSSFNQIIVTFDEPINDPAGNTLPDDVTNPANYLLFMPGTNGVFDTVECSTGIQGDDSAVTIGSVTYNSGLYQASLNINSGVNLAKGQYRLLVCGTTSIVNTSGIPLNDEPGSDSSYDFRIVNPSSSETTIDESTSLAALGLPIPLTGFAPVRVTVLPMQSVNYSSLGPLWLEVPSLDVSAEIVGVPQTPEGWDVTWLGDDIGWLNGTAWPSWNGNAVLTAHVFGADGLPGPFVALDTLKWGDQVLLHSGESVYVYEVREVEQVSPNDLAAVTRHEEFPWLTLVTCANYDDASDTYLSRVLVRAVVISKN
jgi:LPXTG-site transpeptidase (sortase) family protein